MTFAPAWTLDLVSTHQYVRRCTVHHVELDEGEEHMVCPWGHPAIVLKRTREWSKLHAEDLFELWDATEGRTVCVVEGERILSWAAWYEYATTRAWRRLNGRDDRGFTPVMATFFDSPWDNRRPQVGPVPNLDKAGTRLRANDSDE